MHKWVVLFAVLLILVAPSTGAVTSDYFREHFITGTAHSDLSTREFVALQVFAGGYNAPNSLYNMRPEEAFNRADWFLSELQSRRVSGK